MKRLNLPPNTQTSSVKNLRRKVPVLNERVLENRASKFTRQGTLNSPSPGVRKILYAKEDQPNNTALNRRVSPVRSRTRKLDSSHSPARSIRSRRSNSKYSDDYRSEDESLGFNAYNTDNTDNTHYLIENSRETDLNGPDQEVLYQSRLNRSNLG
jgi:hypothetical protein